MKEYLKPKMDILYIPEDVICASGTFGDEADDIVNWRW